MVLHIIKFVDTNILLSHLDELKKEDFFYLSSVSIEELENIKTSSRKSESIKYSARKVVRWLSENPNRYEIIVYDSVIAKTLNKTNLEDTNDNRIISSAKHVEQNRDNLIFVTNDILAKLIAKLYFSLVVESIENHSKDEYKGYMEKSLSENETAYFYENISTNIYDLLVNQYLILKDEHGEVIDTYRWDGKKHQALFNKNIKTIYFDKLKAKDVYQSCAIDSLMNCTITAISGKAGSGKSLLSLMVAMHLIETGKYDRLVIMFNPSKVKGSSDMGYYSGDFIDKAMQNSIGQILNTKFGDRYAVDLLLQQEKIKLVSMADARGMEINGSEILWLTECQNTSIDLIKLCLSRVASGAKVFIEGDYTSQTDSVLFEGENNGLRRAIKVFQGHEEFGYIQLQNVWRSKIAELCELL